MSLRQSITSTDPSTIVHEIRKIEEQQKQLGEEATRALDILHKEMASHRIGSEEAAANIAKLLSEIKDMQIVSSIVDIDMGDKSNLQEEITRLNNQESNIALLEKKLENVQESIDQLVSSLQVAGESPDCRTSRKKKMLPFHLSNTPNMQNIIRAPCSPLSSSKKAMEHDIENVAPNNNTSDVSAASYMKSPPSTRVGLSSREGTPSSRQSRSLSVKKMQRMFKNAAEENIRSIKAYVTELKERVAKLQYQKQLLVCQVN